MTEPLYKSVNFFYTCDLNVPLRIHIDTFFYQHLLCPAADEAVGAERRSDAASSSPSSRGASQGPRCAALRFDATLYLDGQVFSSVSTSTVTVKGLEPVDEKICFPVKLRDLPLNSILVLHIQNVDVGATIGRVVLPLFTQDALMRQGRQLLWVEDAEFLLELLEREATRGALGGNLGGGGGGGASFSELVHSNERTSEIPGFADEFVDVLRLDKLVDLTYRGFIPSVPWLDVHSVPSLEKNVLEFLTAPHGFHFLYLYMPAFPSPVLWSESRVLHPDLGVLAARQSKHGQMVQNTARNSDSALPTALQLPRTKLGPPLFAFFVPSGASGSADAQGGRGGTKGAEEREERDGEDKKGSGKRSAKTSQGSTATFIQHALTGGKPPPTPATAAPLSLTPAGGPSAEVLEGGDAEGLERMPPLPPATQAVHAPSAALSKKLRETVGLDLASFWERDTQEGWGPPGHAEAEGEPLGLCGGLGKQGERERAWRKAQMLAGARAFEWFWRYWQPAMGGWGPTSGWTFPELFGAFFGASEEGLSVLVSDKEWQRERRNREKSLRRHLRSRERERERERSGVRPGGETAMGSTVQQQPPRSVSRSPASPPESGRLQSSTMASPAFSVSEGKTNRRGVSESTVLAQQQSLWQRYGVRVPALRVQERDEGGGGEDDLREGRPEWMFFHDCSLYGEHPAVAKFHKLRRAHQMKAKGTLEGSRSAQARPSVLESQKLTSIIASPRFQLSREEKSLLWTFRRFLTDKPQALPKFLRAVDFADAQESALALKMLQSWEKPDFADALELLSRDFPDITIRQYAIAALEKATDDELELFMVQLVQALRYEERILQLSIGPNPHPHLHISREGSTPVSHSHSVAASPKRPLAAESSPHESSGSTLHLSREREEDARERERIRSTCPLAFFLIERACRSKKIASALHWYLLCEVMDPDVGDLFSCVFVKFFQALNTAGERGLRIIHMLRKQNELRLKLLDIHRTVSKGKRDRVERRTERLKQALQYKGEIPPPEEVGDSVAQLVAAVGGEPSPFLLGGGQQTEGAGRPSLQLQTLVAGVASGSASAAQSTLVMALMKPRLTGRDFTRLTAGASSSSSSSAAAAGSPKGARGGETEGITVEKSSNGGAGGGDSEAIPLPLNPAWELLGFIPQESFLVKSTMAPMVLTCKIRVNNEDDPLEQGGEGGRGDAGRDAKGQTGETAGEGKVEGRAASQVVTKKFLYKVGDDLRQDQLVLTMFILMDNLLKKYGLDLKLTPYKVMALSPSDGMIEFVSGSEALSSILSNYGNDIRQYWIKHRPNGQGGFHPKVLDTFIRSCAGYCVMTYLLGVGDRHLDNLLLDPDGHLFHIDFGFILGKDPKPWPPAMKICKEMVEAMGGMNSKGYQDFRAKCCQAFRYLRRDAKLIVNLLYLMTDARVKDLAANPALAILDVQGKFRLDLREDAAESFLLSLINQSATALFPVVIEKIHKFALYWK
uniref:phosphatidylinositol 3-kinase n=1 Tax=Chromera velia CCMP2878 TaxID=1169474 RepID=A0A0G4G3Q0_9ALVE|eukprot:Cvel_20136.t1-p1 / transcript=Cvel_20136.t1 / gene=Cvel_20136 / organism=Chromera_velia_CCMP2878 / gene_product=Phosphatidylinositol 3-kinase VPS34-like, putative / transcript_product=Phosphatidylinositol 3-kinase VPS34-like, putative / location=Cvel_scaffold1786:6109-23079(-) / protein_length=1473 / sequence_SO=supercontig / SO=protein_coding / is_pseudo=false